MCFSYQVGTAWLNSCFCSLGCDKSPLLYTLQMLLRHHRVLGTSMHKLICLQYSYFLLRHTMHIGYNFSLEQVWYFYNTRSLTLLPEWYVLLMLDGKCMYDMQFNHRNPDSMMTQLNYTTKYMSNALKFPLHYNKFVYVEIAPNKININLRVYL